MRNHYRSLAELLERLGKAAFPADFPRSMANLGSYANEKEMKMAKLMDVEGIGSAYAKKLEDAGLKTVEGLLKSGCSKKGRKEIAQKSGISEKLILGWVNRADLTRIKGVSTQYADLLEMAGVDTVPELAQRNPANLQAKMVDENARKKLVRQVPAVTQVEKWVAQAKELPRIIKH